MFSCCLAPARNERHPGQDLTVETVQVRIGQLRTPDSNGNEPQEKLKVFAEVINNATDNENRIEAAQLQWLMEMVKETLEKDERGSDGRRYATAMLFALATADENKIKFYETEWLVQATLKIAEEESAQSDVKLYVFGLYKEIATHEALQTKMLANKRLMKCVFESLEQSNVQGDIQTFGYALLKNLAIHPSNQEEMMKNSTLMKALEFALERYPPGCETLVNALDLLCTLATSPANKQQFVFSSPFFTPLCEKLLKSEPANSGSRALCLLFMQQLASTDAIREHMYQTKWLLHALERVIQEEEGGTLCKQRAFGVLWSLALSPVVQKDIPRNNKWLIILAKDKALAKEAIESGVKATALGMLWAIAQCDENKSFLFNMKRLVSLTESIIREESPGSESKANAIGLLGELALEDQNRLEMVNSKPIMEGLTATLKTEPFSGSEAKMNTLRVLLNLSQSPSIRLELVGNALVMDALEYSIRNETDPAAQASAFGVLWNFAALPENKQRLYNMPWIVEGAKKGLKTSAATPSTVGDELVANALGLLQNLAGVQAIQVDMWHNQELSDALGLVIETQLARLDVDNNNGLDHEAEESKVKETLTCNAEVLLNGFGLLQNLAFTPEINRSMFTSEWVVSSVQQMMQVEPTNNQLDEETLHAIQCNALGVIWNLATTSEATASKLALEEWILSVIFKCINFNNASFDPNLGSVAYGLAKELVANAAVFKQLATIASSSSSSSAAAVAAGTAAVVGESIRSSGDGAPKRSVSPMTGTNNNSSQELNILGTQAKRYSVSGQTTPAFAVEQFCTIALKAGAAIKFQESDARLQLFIPEVMVFLKECLVSVNGALATAAMESLHDCLDVVLKRTVDIHDARISSSSLELLLAATANPTLASMLKNNHASALQETISSSTLPPESVARLALALL